VSLKPFYNDEFATLYHGRAEEVLPAILAAGAPRPDHFIMDPPYDDHTHDSIRSSYQDGKPIKTVRGSSKGRIDLSFEAMTPEQVLRVVMPAASGWVIAFCSLEMLGGYRIAGGAHFVRSGFWHRINGTPQISGDRPSQPGEGLAILRGSLSGRMRWNRGGHAAFWETCIVPSKARVHKTQKPESLMIDLVAAFTSPGELVCDPFCGSGSTLVSAKRLGRRALGIDMDWTQLREAARRLQQQPLPLIQAGTTRRRQNRLDFAATAEAV
jgi:site-specific DNA-methyltransferase (adenine-specific)